MSISYKDAGVDIDAGAKLVEEIKPFVKKTFNENVIGGIGSFAGAYALPVGYKEPVLLGATDGVGTKLKLAIESKKYDTVGIDLVAMCVNDLICSFAEPMFFLDYYATGKLDVDAAKEVIKGIAEGCRESECALIGGETAEMPGMYSENDFDLAGFAVGIAEKEDVVKERGVKAGDVLIALKSSGVHSNGFSLVRKLFFDKLKWHHHTEFEGKPLIDVLLEPTRIYVKTYKKVKEKVKALAHITGGGLIENLPRVLPENVKAVVRKNHIEPLPIFEFMGKYIDEEEMFRTFNMGVGMVLVVDPADVKDVMSLSGGYIIGELEAGQRGVEIIE
ncbi:phosphoribosylformylglycinamidine cyclo-ligase [Nitrosophilus alvini]|uniref:phosphoribosylformylglycinamidine cyclo-ligase n=1 Tax=Nitrosophilus alvini TaxID=2714855 RepID=UPI00190DB8C0|nr:phosphoribosylformylglycinamidine cyclo-ligase [Nitrosophilus alvini]